MTALHGRFERADAPASGNARPQRPAGDPLYVTNCDDSGPGSLRDTIAQASDESWIDLEQLTCSTITLTTGALRIDVPHLTIATFYMTARPEPIVSRNGRGSGKYASVVTIDGGGSDRVIDASATEYVDLGSLDLRGGSTVGNGGCIIAGGSIYLYLSTVEQCHATDADYAHGKGGGAYAGNRISMFRSHISGNRVDGRFPIGGGLFAAHGVDLYQSVVSDNSAISGLDGQQALAGGLYSHGPTKIAYSTIANNQADLIGGLDLVGLDGDGNPAAIKASTISGNSALRIGGIDARDGVALVDSTIAFNSAGSTSGGIELGASSTFRSSIIARNTASGAPDDIARANVIPEVVVDGAYNLIIASDVTVPADTIDADPQLAPLADNGGPTPTHALMPDSAAIDAIPSTVAPVSRYDQRSWGYERVVNGRADIGAFEFGSPDRIFSDGFEPSTMPRPAAIVAR